jgi:hypothetical protein
MNGENSKQRSEVERCVAEGAAAETEGPAEAGPVCPDLDCALPALLAADVFRGHRVFEEILMLRFETVRKAENLKAVAIADGPELHLG